MTKESAHRRAPWSPRDFEQLFQLLLSILAFAGSLNFAEQLLSLPS